jgi:hypothetical protein
MVQKNGNGVYPPMDPGEVNKGLNRLSTGIYTVGEAAYLVGASKRKVRGWVEGYRKEPPIITNEIGWIDDRVAFSFTSLMEMRFIAFFEGLAPSFA